MSPEEQMEISVLSLKISSVVTQTQMISLVLTPPAAADVTEIKYRVYVCVFVGRWAGESVSR